jgi:hypothetical protein
MAKKNKVGGCKKRIRPKKVSKGQRRNNTAPHGKMPSAFGAHLHQ